MEILTAAKYGIPVEYLHDNKNIFISNYSIEKLTELYGELEANMIMFKTTNEYKQSSLFINEVDFQNRYDSWSKRYTNLLKKTLIDAKSIKDTEDMLIRIPRYNTSKLNVEKEFKKYTLNLKNKIFDTTNIFEIFDHLNVSLSIPAIHLRHKDRTLTKIYDDPRFKDVDYSRLFSKISEKGLNIFSLVEGSDPKNVISYNVSIVSPGNVQGQLEIDTSLEWEEIFDDNFTKINEKIIRINFNFSIFIEDEIAWPVFIYGIATSDFLSKWLFLFETTSTYIFSNEDIEKFYIGFRRVVPVGQDAPSMGNFRIIHEQSQILIKASKVMSGETMKLMYDFIPRLLKFYQGKQDDYIQEIKKYLYDYSPTFKDINYVPETKYKALEKSFPDLFHHDDSIESSVDGVKYGSACQCKKQPVFIEEDEVEDARNFKLEDGSDRMVRWFPPAHPTKGLQEGSKPFFCPNPDTPYPSLKSNMDFSTIDRYSMVPNCVKVDNFEEAAKKYWETSADPSENVDFIASQNDQPISSKRLEKGSIGKINTFSNSFLKLVFDIYFEDVTFVRFGTKNVTPNSVINCILEALKLPQDEDLWSIRRRIFKDINFTMLYQSFWHLNDDQIENNLEEFANSKDAIDTKIYLHLLETVFDVHIYVLTEDGYEIPQSKAFYIKNHPSPTDKCIVLWKYPPDAIVKYPTYDLIYYIDKTGSKVELHPIDQINFFIDNVHNIYNYSFDFKVFKEVDDTWLKIGSCIFNLSDFFIKKYNLEEFAVTFDSFGKVSIKHVISPQGLRFSLRVPPNVPRKLLPVTDEVYPQTLENIISTFGNPRNIDLNIAYYSYNLYHEEIGVIIEHKIEYEMQKYDLSGLIEKSWMLKDVIDYLLQTAKDEKDLETLIGKIKSDESEKLFTITQRYLPGYSNLDDALGYLEKHSPNIRDGNIHLKDFSAKSAIDYIASYDLDPSVINKKDFIEKRLDTKYDFEEQENTRIFLTEKELDTWNSSYSRKDFFEIENKLEARSNVYMYYDESLFFIYPATSLENAKEISQSFLFPGEEYLSDYYMLFEEIGEKMYRKKLGNEPEEKPLVFSQVLRYFNGQYAAVVEVFRPSELDV